MQFLLPYYLCCSTYFHTGEGRKRSQMSIANCSDFTLNIVEPDIVDLTGSLKKPSGAIEPCILKKMGEAGQLGNEQKLV